MNRHIRTYLDARQAVVEAHNAESRAYRRARQSSVPLPKRLRPAVAADIVEGAIIWYPRFREDGHAGWKLVETPLHYGDDWKAFTAEDGCRYGLHEAFVEIGAKVQP